jgi:hypothetical protein
VISDNDMDHYDEDDSLSMVHNKKGKVNMSGTKKNTTDSEMGHG